MPRLENLQAFRTLNPLSGPSVNPADPAATDKPISAPITNTQAETQGKTKSKHFHEIQIFVDSDSWINIYISKWIKAYFDVKDAPGGILGSKDTNFYTKRTKLLPPKNDKPAARKKTNPDSSSPGPIRGMRLIYLPLNPEETPVKSGDLANHPQSKKNGPRYLTMRIPLVANLDAIAVFIETQFNANKPTRFYTDRGTTVTVIKGTNKSVLGTHPGLKAGVQTGTR